MDMDPSVADALDPLESTQCEQESQATAGQGALDSSSAGSSAGPVPHDAIVPDDLIREADEDEAAAAITLPKLQMTQAFVDMLGTASLENSGMDPDDILGLHTPEPGYDLVNPSPLLRLLRHFVNNTGASWDHYDSIWAIKQEHNPRDVILSFDQVKQHVQWLSGVVPFKHDMCPGSCVAYTGPYEELDSCPKCSTPQYVPGETKKAQRRFSTIPIGPVIQALYGSREIAEHMHYLERRLARNVEYVRVHGRLNKYDDTACGQELVDAWNSGTFGHSDIALQFSIDSAQLWPDQPSEAWVFIWVIHNLPPSMRYKKDFVIPGAIVPGPNKPGDLESFLFPSLYHIAALQREGLRIYDSLTDTIIPCLIPCMLFSTADSLGSAAMSGMVGHVGKYGCSLYCDMIGRRRENDSH
jgi:hypothetical protein